MKLGGPVENWTVRHSLRMYRLMILMEYFQDCLTIGPRCSRVPSSYFNSIFLKKKTLMVYIYNNIISRYINLVLTMITSHHMLCYILFICILFTLLCHTDWPLHSFTNNTLFFQIYTFFPQ